MTESLAASRAGAARWTCPFCLLLCDHLSVQVGASGHGLELAGGDCARARAALAAFGVEPAVAPPQVDVTLTGALLAVEKARSSLVPVVKPAPDGKPREVEVTIDGLPPGIGVKVSPEHVKLDPLKQPAAPPPPRTP